MDVDEPRPSNFSSIGSRNGMNKSVLSGKAGSGVKKLVIRNAKASTLPENFYGSTWAQLREAIDAVHESRPTRSNLEDLYGCVESICTHNLSARLYDDLRLVCQQKVCKIAHELSNNQSDQFEFLASVGHEWEQHCRQMVMIRSIFLVIDRKYTLQTAGINSLWEVGLELFRQCVLCGNSGGSDKSGGSSAVCVRTVDGILALLQKERMGELVNSSLIKCLLSMLSDLHIYSQFFEARFLDATEHLYRYEGLELMATLDTTEYLRRVSRRLAEEEERATRYLDHSTRKPLIRTVEKQLLEAHVEEILAKGFSTLVSENRVVELKSLFELFQRAKALTQLKNSFSDYIKLTGSGIVMNPANDEQMVSELLAFKDKVDAIATNCFNNMELYTLAIREAFENFINKRQNKPAEMIAKYIDSRLKSGNKESSEEELEKLMDKVMVIFRFIHGKDVFEAFYKKDLAKRLLVGRSASVDAEKSMLSKLKQECGAQFTSKLEGMFKDIELSRDIMTNFKLHLDSRTKANEEETVAAKNTPVATDAHMKDADDEPQDQEGSTSMVHSTSQQDSTGVSIGGVVSGDIELVVSVLTMGFWPTYPAIEVNLPKDMEQYLECFKQFYLAKHSGRKLKWQSTLGHCIVKAKFTTGVKELHVSLFQALVILLFNDGESYTYQQIKEHTNVEDGELIRTLQSLSLGKKDSRVLKKQPMGKDVAATDSFSIVNDFQNKHFRIKINQIQLKETKQEAETTQEQVFADRVYQVDAAVVRIMKTRKTLTHNELVTQLIHQLRFPVKASDLKKRIESLIEREYMKRDADNVNSYIYVA